LGVSICVLLVVVSTRNLHELLEFTDVSLKGSQEMLCLDDQSQ
jgi:hypothetical protein